MSNPYKTREGGATVTVFVPYDCNNHCPFCINKKEYADCSGFSLDAILRSIHTMDEITPRCDFVFTGGEPLADLGSLQKMLDAIPNTHRIFINTTFPVQQKYSADEMIAFTKRNRDKITCINISRHLVKYVEESPDEVVGRIACPTRINCVLYKNYPAQKLTDYVERFLPYRIPIQFRYDYTETTPENLYEEEHDKILQDLKKQFTYKGLDGCRMRNGFHFEYQASHDLPQDPSLFHHRGDWRRRHHLRHSVRYPHQAERRDPLRLDRREAGRGEVPPRDLRALRPAGSGRHHRLLMQTSPTVFTVQRGMFPSLPQKISLFSR